MDSGSIVVVHLIEPSEKYWGRLSDMSAAGVTLRAINLDSLDDWMRSIVYEEEAAGLGLATIFFPLRRVERMFLDEPVGGIESLAQLFERRTGTAARDMFAPGN